MDVSRMKIILAAGGSGGHIFPCVSLASELEKAGVGRIFFVSSRRRLDMNLLKDIPYPRSFLSVNPMPMTFSVKGAIVFAFKCLWDIIRSIWITLKIRPDVVVGFGGYSSGTISLVAKIMGAPLVIHEQNMVPGRANMILGRIADKIALSFPLSASHFGKHSKKTVFTGNPIRLDVLESDRKAAARRMEISPDRDTVLVMGGSQGSSFLNKILLEVALDIRNQKGDSVQFVHITGKNADFEISEKFFLENKIPGKVFSFLERIDDAYSVSDIAVSRSGAAAIFELAYYGKPMILVPYPNPKNNQRSNAVFFASSGAAVLREEKDLSRETLTRDILEVLGDREKRSRMSEAALKMAFPGAGKALASQVIGSAKRRKNDGV
jgi:UDP-N-acetylglucosamine--N-acetylmuramyl-(pentapeptide) pyrophosphoryl-undecaprenol N-acetylglucosamine transferase